MHLHALATILFFLIICSNNPPQYGPVYEYKAFWSILSCTILGHFAHQNSPGAPPIKFPKSRHFFRAETQNLRMHTRALAGFYARVEFQALLRVYMQSEAEWIVMAEQFKIASMHFLITVNKFFFQNRIFYNCFSYLQPRMAMLKLFYTHSHFLIIVKKLIVVQCTLFALLHIRICIFRS